MNQGSVFRVAGVILVCVGIFYGLGNLLSLIVFGAGLAMLVLP